MATDQNSRPGPSLSPRVLVIAASAFLVLAFASSFLGARLGSLPAAETDPLPSQTATATVTPDDEEEYAGSPVLPAGADVRAGQGLPSENYGDDGDVFVDMDSSDIYVRIGGAWQLRGNIRDTAAASLTGPQGEAGQAGEAGAQGEPGAQGDAGAPGDAGASGENGRDGADGTRVGLGVGGPSGTCQVGDVHIDTATVQFYDCSSGQWSRFGPVGVDG